VANPAHLGPYAHPPEREVSRKLAIIFGQGTILGPSAPHIGREVALVAQTAAFVYIYARISQIAEIHTSLYATGRAMSGRRGSSSAPPGAAASPLSIGVFSDSQIERAFAVRTLYAQT
jgi:hypothetical protein